MASSIIPSSTTRAAILFGGADPDLRPPLELFLVTGKLVVVHFAPKFLKCVLKLRLEDVAREEHACDPGRGPRRSLAAGPSTEPF